jgi:hypothetical protein
MLLRSLIFILISNLNYSQDPLKLVYKAKHHFVFYDSNTFYLYNYDGKFEDSFYASNKILNEIDLNSLDLPAFKKNKFIYSDDNNHKIVSVGGGHVYEVVNDTLRRIDFSFNHKMTNGGAVFKKNDTIFKFGGYGFWSSRNFFTYFDPSSKEWEFYPSNSTLLPPPIHDFNYSLINDDFFIINGYSPNVINGKKNYELSEIWKFNFNEKKWYNLGVSNLPYYDNYISIDDKTFFARKVNSLMFMHVDILNNKFNYVEIANTSFPINGLDTHIVKDTLYAFKDGNFIKKPYRELIFPSDRFDSSEKRIYLWSIELLNGLGLSSLTLLGILIFSIMFLKFKQNQKPRITDLGLRYKGTTFDMEAAEKNIIQALISKNEVFSQEIYDIVENKSLSYPQNNKIKNDTIKKLNKKLYKILGVKHFIKSKKMPEDARVIIYYTQYANMFFRKKKI